MATPPEADAAATPGQQLQPGPSVSRKSGELHRRDPSAAGPEPPSKRGRANTDQASGLLGAGSPAVGQPPPFPSAFAGQQAQATPGAVAAGTGAEGQGQPPRLLALKGDEGRPGSGRAGSSGNSTDTRQGSRDTVSSIGSGLSQPQGQQLPLPLAAADLPLPQPSSSLAGIQPAVPSTAALMDGPGGGGTSLPTAAGAGITGGGGKTAAGAPGVKAEGIATAGGAASAAAAAAASDAPVARRVIANRQSAARSKERRRGYIIGLEQSVKNLTLQINEQQGHLHGLASNSATLCTANYALSQHASGLEDRLRQHEAEMAALREECDRLRQLALAVSAGTPLEAEVNRSLPPPSAASSGVSGAVAGEAAPGRGTSEAQSARHQVSGSQQQHQPQQQQQQPQQQSQQQPQPHGQQQQQPSPLPHIRGGDVSASRQLSDPQQPPQQPSQQPHRLEPPRQPSGDVSGWEQYMDWGAGGRGDSGELPTVVPAQQPQPQPPISTQPTQDTPMADASGAPAAHPAVQAAHPAAQAPHPAAPGPDAVFRRPSIRTGDDVWRSSSLGSQSGRQQLSAVPSRSVVSGVGSGGGGGGASVDRGQSPVVTAAAAAGLVHPPPPPPPPPSQAPLPGRQPSWGSVPTGTAAAPATAATMVQWFGNPQGLPPLPVHWPPGFDAAAASAAAAAVVAAGPSAFMIPPPALQPLLQAPSSAQQGPPAAGVGGGDVSGGDSQTLGGAAAAAASPAPSSAPSSDADPALTLERMRSQSASAAQMPAAPQSMTPAELDALIARYAAAAPPGSRAREQAARVQDVASLRLSSAPGSMQIRIAGLPLVPQQQHLMQQLPQQHLQQPGPQQMAQMPGMPPIPQPRQQSLPHMPGMPPIPQPRLQSLPHMEHIPQPLQQMRQQMQPQHMHASASVPAAAGGGGGGGGGGSGGGGATPMDAAATQTPVALRGPSVDLDTMADILDSFVADEDNFPGL